MTTTTIDIREDFRQAIVQAGLCPPDEILPDGRFHRFASNGNPYDDAGWYKFHNDGLPAGAFGCFRSLPTQTWCAKPDQQMTPEERAEYRTRIAAIQRQRDGEVRRRHARVAKDAQTLWEQNELAPADHPYLVAKQVQPHGLRVQDAFHQLIIPMMINDTITSLQFISADGDKLFLHGGAIKGSAYLIGDLTEAAIILIAEGYATGASLHEATGAPVVIAFYAANLTAVAKSLRQQYPTATIVLCGDNDIHESGAPNTGLIEATAAAIAIEGRLVMPDLGGKPCDWNDVAREHGPEAVREAIDAALGSHVETPPVSDSSSAEAPPSDAPESEPDEPLRCTDVGNGELFARQHRQRVRYCFGLKQWYVWDGQRWNPDDGGGMTRLAKQTARSLYDRAANEPEEHHRKALAKWAAESETERRLKSLVTMAQSEPGIAIEVDELDVDPLLLNVQNGTLDLRTGMLRPARREDFITKLAPVVYRPEATCPVFMGLLDRLFSKVPALREYLQRIFGYALTGLTIEQCFFIFYGTGSNGKSTVLRMILDLLGEYAATTRPETFLVKYGDGIPNDVAALAGARFVLSLEPEQGKRLAEGLVKAVTGGDKLSARFLH